ncbi:MAG: hypothetical protein ACTSXH_17725 [Promethearchaeota archaeon]
MEGVIFRKFEEKRTSKITKEKENNIKKIDKIDGIKSKKNGTIKKKRIIETKAFKLALGSNLFKKMIANFPFSLKRKCVPIQFIEEKSITPQRKWLREKLTKDKLKKISNFISAHRIGKILGLDHQTIISFAKEEYGFEFFSGGYYATINNSLRWYGKSSSYYNDFIKWKEYLEKLGKFSK